MSLVVISVLILWPELGLRALGWEPDDAGAIHFGYPRPKDLVRLRTDPELFWTLPPGERSTNSAGFLGGEFVIPKPSDEFRAVFLGDSCTQQGFPLFVALELNQDADFLGRIGRNRVACVNLGISGYSSYQGRVVARRWVARLEPDLAVLYFGWNDHWQAYGRTDAERGSAVPAPGSGLAAASVLVQFLRRSLGKADAPLTVPRVSLEEYRDNLAAIGDEVRAAGGRVALITAPTTYYTLGVPAYLVEQGFAASDARAIELHRSYNQVARALAEERGWWLLDLERETSEDPRRLRQLFLTDGIHFTPMGLRWVAGAVAAKMRARL